MKPTKKQIEELAEKLFYAAFSPETSERRLRALWREPWLKTLKEKRRSIFHLMAKYVLTEHPPVWRKPKVKVCRLVKGKAVCS
jgi:hypothetical protein